MNRRTRSKNSAARHLEPLGVVADLRPLAVEHLERLLLVGERVRLDLLGAQHRADVAPPAGIAHARRVVADDQDDRVPEVLKGAELLEHDRVPQVDVGRGRIHAELDPQRPAALELLGQASLGQRVDRAREHARRALPPLRTPLLRMARQCYFRWPMGFNERRRERAAGAPRAPRHPGADAAERADAPHARAQRRPRPPSCQRRRSEPAATTEATATATSRTRRLRVLPGGGGDGTATATNGDDGDEAAPSPTEEAPRRPRLHGPRAARARLVGLRDHDGRRPGPSRAREPRPVRARRELGHPRPQRQHARHPHQQRGPHPRRLRRDRPGHEGSGRRDRGQALLRAPRRRLPGHRPRALPGRPRRLGRAGRLDHHPAVRKERARRAEQTEPSSRSSARPRSPTSSSATGTKDKIITEYLNSIYFGEGAYGIEAAAKTYFGTAHEGCGEEGQPTCASELLPYEAAMLAGIIASPIRLLPPRSARRAAEERRNLVLFNMREQGYITEEEYVDYSARLLPRASTIEPPADDSAAPYFTSWLRQQLVDRYGAGEAFGGGLVVESTLDLELPAAASRTRSRRASTASASTRRSSSSTTRPPASSRWSAATTTPRSPSTSPPTACASPARRSSRSRSSRRSRRVTRRARSSTPLRSTSPSR